MVLFCWWCFGSFVGCFCGDYIGDIDGPVSFWMDGVGANGGSDTWRGCICGSDIDMPKKHANIGLFPLAIFYGFYLHLAQFVDIKS